MKANYLHINKVIRTPDLEELVVQWEISAGKIETNSEL